MPIDPAEADLRRLHRAKQLTHAVPGPIGPAAVAFFNGSVRKRQVKLERLAEAWAALVPPVLGEHCALDGLHRGTLTVLVDSSSHRYELKQLLLAGLEDQLLMRCRPAGLRRVALRPGRWYAGGDGDDRRVTFG